MPSSVCGEPSVLNGWLVYLQQGHMAYVIKVEVV